MGNTKIVAICLNAYDMALSDRMIDEGRLKGLAKLRDRSARYLLEHGEDNLSRTTGLTGEHVATGLKPETTNRWSPILFDAKTYRTYQKFTEEIPYLAHTSAKSVVFDSTFFDLEKVENAVGIVDWSGHDPGVNPYARPASLREEIETKFGPCIDNDELNENVYVSAQKTARFSKLVAGMARKRNDVAKWLLTERFTDWDLGVVTMSEAHDAIEQLYHGVGEDSVLSDAPSAAAAREGMIEVYEAISDGVEMLMEALPDAAFVVFSMHGMGRNETDVPSMILLPELMYRMNFGRPYFDAREDWARSPAPMLNEDERWTDVVLAAMKHPTGHALERLPGRTANKAKRITRKLAGAPHWFPNLDRSPLRDDEFEADWVPANQYRDYWPKMTAFGLPSLFEGQIRINLEGREGDGVVPLEAYDETLDALTAEVSACVDAHSGEPVVRDVITPFRDDPMAVNASQADLTVLWKGSPLGLRHPKYGRIGPAPVRRTGGHTGRYGGLYLAGAGPTPGDYGVRSSFDVAPTILDLLNRGRPNRLDGDSVLTGLAQAAG